MNKTRRNYKEDLLSDLRDPEYAAGYLSACMAESVETFLLALRHVADAQKGMAKVASAAGVNRENLYRMLSDDGNPRLRNLHAVLDVLGVKIVLESKSIKAVNAISSKTTEPLPSSTAPDHLDVKIERTDTLRCVRSHRYHPRIPRSYGGGTQVPMNFGVETTAV